MSMEQVGHGPKPGSGDDQVGPRTAYQIVSQDANADQPLTRAGLQAAIDALPAGGGDIYLGEGTLTWDGTTITCGKDVNIWGAGVGVTSIVLGSNTGVFFNPSASGISVTWRDVNVLGGTTADQTLIQLGASLNSLYLVRVVVGSLTGSIINAVRTVIDYNGQSIATLALKINQCHFAVNNSSDSTAAWFLKDVVGPVYITDTLASGHASIRDSSGSYHLKNLRLILTGAASATFGTTETVGCTLGSSSTGSITFGATSHINGGTVVRFVAGGDGILATGVRFSSAFTHSGYNRNQFVGCDFNGLTFSVVDSQYCHFDGLHNATVTESGTSDYNVFRNMTGTTTITQSGANSEVRYQGGEYAALISNVDGSSYATSGIPYIPLGKEATEEYVEFSHVFRKTRKLVFDLIAAMSTDHSGNVVFEVDYTRVADSDSPNNALTTQTQFTWLPGAGTQKKTLKGNSQSTMQISGEIGEKIWVRLTRKNVAGDTHTGDVNVIDVVVN